MIRKLRAALAPFLICPIAWAAGPASSLDWISGHWCTEVGAETVDELWLPPRGDIVVGMSQTSTKNHTMAFEYLRIAEVGGVLTYLAQPGGRPPTAFGRTAGGDRWIRFENPDHDFPQRIEYRRQDDMLHAEIAGPGEDGEEIVIAFDYRRCDR